MNGIRPLVTFDVTSNSLSVWKEAIWKKNLAVYQKSRRAFFQATLYIQRYTFCSAESLATRVV